MNMNEFSRSLQSRTRPEVAQEIPTAILFSVDDQTLRFEPQTNDFAVSIGIGNGEIPVLHAASWQSLHDVLIGKFALLDAFKDRAFWTNGYLPLLFTLQALFQPDLSSRLPE